MEKRFWILIVIVLVLCCLPISSALSHCWISGKAFHTLIPFIMYNYAACLDNNLYECINGEIKQDEQTESHYYTEGEIYLP